ncbi:hypothetical protein NR800_08390 [Corallococcus interemptor]|uniref:hypothetical protein n=1 Tax=Corallococcus interemptor TaxID=2316720 RepID=UPI0035D4710E
MGTRKILSVGIKLPGDFDFIPLNSKQSLTDADIAIIRPSFFEEFDWERTHKGIPSFDEETSFQILNTITHWQTEVSAALNRGTTVLIYLCDREDFHLDTGRRSHDIPAKRLLERYSNYEFLTNYCTFTNHQGTEITKTRDSSHISAYWDFLGPKSEYRVFIEPWPPRPAQKATCLPLLKTKKGEHVVAALIRPQNCAPLVLLPRFAYEPSELASADGKLSNEEILTFGKRLTASLAEIDKSVQSPSNESPTPDWAKSHQYLLPIEISLSAELNEAHKRLDEVSAFIKKKNSELDDAGQFKALLYGTGKQLEAAILQGLQALGFAAAPLKTAESEFDAVFSAPEGRFLGEAEGKDNSPINVDKLRQLEMNRQEDFANDDVDELATGVLFGNAFRLQPPEERGEFFTRKCLSAAERSGVALVRTPDLFKVVRTILESTDKDYAARCRKALIEQRGQIVVFPSK